MKARIKILFRSMHRFQGMDLITRTTLIFQRVVVDLNPSLDFKAQSLQRIDLYFNVYRNFEEEV